jgi:NitT/TauT family transport system substrate-binding protein
VGKKVGVPGLGAFLHVGFRAWLKQSGVDYKKVNFVEASFPQHGDLLRGGSLDAVVSADPFMARITESGAGYVASYYGTFLHRRHARPSCTRPSRDWVEKNQAATARNFREALVEAAAFLQQAEANEQRVRAAIGKYIKVPPEVLAKMQISPPGPVVTEKQLDFWVKLMKDQEMLRTEPELATLIAK